MTREIDAGINGTSTGIFPRFRATAPAPRVKTDIERMAVVEDEGMDNANAESRR